MAKMSQTNLPFEVGQVVEAKSFEIGYRGAWFRCKIIDVITEEKELYYNLEYLDFPDEEILKTKAYQKPPGREKEGDYLMVRPAYPPHYHESEFLKMKPSQEPLLAVVHDSWKVGDLVDWWKDDCYWSGKVLKVKKNNKAQVELLPIPIGEGKDYEASCKDLRPSLEWSLEDGWIVPLSKDGQKRQCAKLIKQKNEEEAIPDTCEEEQSSEKGDEGLVLNIMESDEIEAAVYDLEELIARIEWLKSMLKPDVGAVANSNWMYFDHLPSSKRM